MPGSYPVLSRTAIGAVNWSAPGDARGLPITFRAIVQGTGAVSGSVDVYQGGDLGGSLYFDATPAVTLDPVGTDSGAVSESFEATGNQEWRFDLTSISANTTVSVVASW